MVPEKLPPAGRKKSTKTPSPKPSGKAAKEKNLKNLEIEGTEQVTEEKMDQTVHAEPVVETRTPAPLASAPKPTATFKEGDDYTFLVRYDKTTKLFVGQVVEVTDCKTQGMNREEVLKDLKIKLEDYIEDHRVQGMMPEPIFSKQYPEKLTVTVSQSVYRKLDLLSRLEKVPLEQLTVELLSSASDRRLESGKNAPKQSHGGQSQQPRHSHHGGRHGGGHNRNRHNQGNLDSRENFMEYVRNLEKGGSRWKK